MTPAARLSSLIVILLAGATAFANSLGYDGAAPPVGDGTPAGSSYMLTDGWGGTCLDAEKSPTNTQDDLMCWAAAAANVLQWTGWAYPAGTADADDVFGYFQDHWTDKGGLMGYGWDWWFDGTNNKQGYGGWSQVDSPGGGFYPAESFGDHFRQSWDAPQAMSRIDEYLRAGCGVTLAVYVGNFGGHALTCWGVNYNLQSPSEYYGIWVTDSDDSKYLTDPPDLLRYYEVEYWNGKWYLQDFYGRSGHSDYYTYHIGGVQALGHMPDAVAPPVPEPVTLLGLATGLAGLGGYLRRRRHA